jgi:aspartyl-tRNA(Asn)/glutamyl-tRNA(Gln) amidotransferase subunit A
MPEYPLTATDAARLLRAGEVTSVELTQACIERADRLDDQLGTYVTRFDEAAMAAATDADALFSAGVDRGPLQGIPIGVKDILAQSDGPTTAQSLILDRAWGEGKDAPVVARLKAGGAVITGKLSTMEFAIGMPDPTKPFPIPRNPWDTDTWPGGSSSGTGNGVAAGLFYAGIGTDTGGSIRIPAAFCGTSGLMPTFGRVPKSGCVPLGYTLDHIGPLARSAADCGAFLGVIAGFHPSDPYCVDRPVPDFIAGLDGNLSGVRIGVERAHHSPEDGDPALSGCFEGALEVLASLGATIVDVEIAHYNEVVTAAMLTMSSEALAYHRNDLVDRWGDYFLATKQYVALGALVSGADYVQAQRVRRVGQAELAALFGGVDLIVMPTAAVGSPRYDQMDEGLGDLLGKVYTPYWDAVGNPVMVVPMGFTDGGLPLSLQMAARPFDEALLVRAGDAFQTATEWHLQVPPLAAPVAS